MQLEQFVEQLEGAEQVEYQALVEESQNGGDDKAIRGRLARLAMEVLKRLGEKPNPGPVIGQFTKLYPPAQSAAGSSDLPAAEMKPLEDYPQALVQPMAELQKSKDPASSHKALLDLGEALLVYLTGIQFGEYRKSWPLDEEIEAEFYKNAKRKPSFGVFLGFLRRLVKAEGESILDHLFHKKAQFNAVSEYVLVYDLLSQVINQGQDDNFQTAVEELKQGRTVPKRNLLNFYDSFISMRNSYAHPEDKAKNPERKWPLGEDYYSLVNPYVQAGLEELIANLVVITEYKPILVEDVDDMNSKGEILIELGRKGVKQTLDFQADELQFIDTDLRYLLNREERPFARLYYNELPQLDSSIAKKIMAQEKAKMMEPVLTDMIRSKLTDGLIDEMEYMVLKESAYASAIDEERLRHLVEKVKGELQIEGDVYAQQKEVEAIPVFSPWWLLHIGALNQNKVEKDEDPFTDTNRHKMLWKEVTRYLEYLVTKHLNNETQLWAVQPNQYQIGNLSYTYWGQIYPLDSPLENAFSIGFAISKKFKWAKAGRKNSLHQKLNNPSLIIFTTYNERYTEDIDNDQSLLRSYLNMVYKLLFRERETLGKMGAKVQDYRGEKEENGHYQLLIDDEAVEMNQFFEDDSGDDPNGMVCLLSEVWSVEDLMEGDELVLENVYRMEREMIAFIQIFSSVVNQINDLALENGINRETVKRLRDRARRFKTRVEKEAQAKVKSDPSLDAVSYIHQQAAAEGLSQEKTEELISKMGWLKTKPDGVKASKGNREKFEAVRKHHPESLTITSKELDEVSTAEGLATIWFIKDNFGTGKRGEYYIPELVDGEFVMPTVNTDSEKNEE